jgi:hypothetical protein
MLLLLLLLEVLQEEVTRASLWYPGEACHSRRSRGVDRGGVLELMKRHTGCSSLPSWKGDSGDRWAAVPL